jgi:hypothetical protein
MYANYSRESDPLVILFRCIRNFGFRCLYGGCLKMKKRPLFFLAVLISSLLEGCGATVNTQASAATSASFSTVSQQTTVVTSNITSNVTSNITSSSSVSIESGKDLYVSPNGGSELSADGSKEKPYAYMTGIAHLHQGHTMFLLAGTYKSSVPLKADYTTDYYPATCEEERKTVTPYFDENGKEAEVRFDFSSMLFDSSNRGITFNTDYWTFQDCEVYGAGDNGVYVGGNHIIIQNLNIHDNQDSGLQIGRWSSSKNSIDQWPSYNLIKNCTSHDNHDPTGEDSDGFACKLTTGVGNVFDGCISYNNVDDGWDLYAKADSGPIGPVMLQNCVSFNNGITSYGVGTANSDGNGFKLGGEGIAVAHKVINCVAFNNLATGFTDNSNPGTIDIENCTSFNNGTRDFDANNFDMCRDASTSVNYYKNLLSFCYGTVTSPIDGTVRTANSKDQFRGTASYCAFYYGMSILKFGEIQACNYTDSSLNGTLEDPGDLPFVSIVSPQVQASKGIDSGSHPDLHKTLRNTDGSIKLGDFLKLKDGSKFTTMGANGDGLGAFLSGEGE